MAMDFFITIGMLVVAGTNRRSVGSLAYQLYQQPTTKKPLN